MHYPVIAFIGAGNMSSAIIAGLVKSGYPAEKIIAANRGAEKLQHLSDKFAIRSSQNNSQAANDAEVIVLGVKPFLIQSVCEEIKSSVTGQLIISIAAGKTITSINRFLQNDNPVIRAMPNTPCLLSKGAIGLFAGREVSQTNRDFVNSLFENIGETVWLETEQKMDIVTALSGSGPAYYFYLTEALVKAGVELGLDEAVSRKLVSQTAAGAVAMLSSEPIQSAEALRKAVTSPNGTTEAAINIFEENNLMQIIGNAVRSATERGQEMSKEAE